MIQKITPVSKQVAEQALFADEEFRQLGQDLGWRIFKSVLVFGIVLQIILGVGETVKYSTTYLAVYGNPGNWFRFIALYEIGWLLSIPLISVVVSDIRLSRFRLFLYLIGIFFVCFVGSAVVFHEFEHWISRTYFNGTVGASLKCYGQNYHWISAVAKTTSKLSVFASMGLAIRFWIQQEYSSARSAKLDQLVAKLRHESLCNRVRPHFLFNTLNTIASLSNTRPNLARDIVGRLGTLLRESLEAMDAKRISLGHEYSLLEDYLTIQKARFGSSLTYELELPNELESRLVPGFILQPLVENCVKHGIQDPARGEAPLHIAISSTENSAGQLCISVSDNGAGSTGRTEVQEKRGLRLTRNRLEMEYGDLASLHFNEVDQGFSVKLNFDRKISWPNEFEHEN